MQPAQPDQMNIYNVIPTYATYIHLDHEPRVQERQEVREQQPYISISVL